ncbi:MAG: uroporphyrinogen-III C-methyltransferase [Pseudomonadota bacterium]|jgi:uroporphyrin-III C-methyltransferase
MDTAEVRVVFVGAGPGSADLITVRGLNRLRAAEIVLADALTDPALRAEAPDAEWIDVGKRGFSSESTGQMRINALLVESARRSARVVRLKGGDPSMFGRLEEELEALRAAGIGCEVVPGVTSALAAAAVAQQPLTRRGVGRSVAFSTAMTRTGELQARRSADTEVFYMAGRQLASLAGRLAEVGWPADMPVTVISRAGWPDERSSRHTVATLADADAPHGGRPTLVLVGAGARPVADAHDAAQGREPATVRTNP